MSSYQSQLKLGMRDSNSRVPLKQLKVAKQEGILNFINNEQAYINNATRDIVPPNPSEIAMQKMWGDRYHEKQ